MSNGAPRIEIELTAAQLGRMTDEELDRISRCRLCLEPYQSCGCRLGVEQRKLKAHPITTSAQIAAEPLASSVEAEKEGFEPSIPEDDGGKRSVDIFGGQA